MRKGRGWRETMGRGEGRVKRRKRKRKRGKERREVTDPGQVTGWSRSGDKQHPSIFSFFSRTLFRYLLPALESTRLRFHFLQAGLVSLFAFAAHIQCRLPECYPTSSRTQPLFQNRSSENPWNDYCLRCTSQHSFFFFLDKKNPLFLMDWLLRHKSQKRTRDIA